MLRSLAFVVSVLAATPAALAECAEAEAEFAAFLEQRYGAESSDATIFASGPIADRWGIAASSYISFADQLLVYAIPGRIPFILIDDFGRADELAETARVALVAEVVAMCLRPVGTPMIIGDRDMGAQFDETHSDVRRDAIRTFAESLL
ncbi:MAG: hypothetical protein AAGA87_08550 [Pseudomonadota bacterium]